MPRLIPRLLRALDYARSRPPRSYRRPAPSPYVAPTDPIKEFTRPEEVDISPAGRTQSILLDRKALRLIYRHARYQRSKGIAPYVYVSESRWRAKQARGRAPLGMQPREMTEEERSFYANPYLRMLGSPLRQCFQTNWMVPREMLIRMTPMLLPTTPPEKTKCTFLPSGLEHPAFSRFQGGRSGYLLCHKRVVEFVREKGSYRRFSPEGVYTVPMHPLITQQIGHLLRLRVLQELQMLTRRLLRRRRQAKSDEPPLLRRLTRAEWAEIKTSGVVPYKNAVAILVVPPQNRDPETKTRPSPSTGSVPNPEDLLRKDMPSSLPLSVMHPTAQEEFKLAGLPDTVPPSQVPLYNGVSMFPSRTQRAALHAALGEVLRAERTTHLMTESTPSVRGSSGISPNGAPLRVKGDQKASHAILVCSDEKTILRGDTVPLAIALWRIRMWEGVTGEDCFVDWMADPPREA